MDELLRMKGRVVRFAGRAGLVLAAMVLITTMTGLVSGASAEDSVAGTATGTDTVTDTGPVTDSGARAFVYLVSDGRNDAVYCISSDGGYLGDFLLVPAGVGSGAGEEQPNERVSARVLGSPRRMLFRGGAEPELWLAAERALSLWNMDGEFRRVLIGDSDVLEDPAGILETGGRIFLLSQDKSSLLVVDGKGEVQRTVRSIEFERSKDLKIAADGKLLVGSSVRSYSGKGLVTAWDVAVLAGEASTGNTASGNVEPAAWFVPPGTRTEGILSAHAIAVESPDALLVVDYGRGQLERWSLKSNTRTTVLLEGGGPGAFRSLRIEGDCVLLAGDAGLYRFPVGSTATDLSELQPFFPAASIPEKYSRPFSPTDVVGVPATVLTGHPSCHSPGKPGLQSEAQSAQRP